MKNHTCIESDECQLQVVYDDGQKLAFFDRTRNIYLRLASAARRRVRRVMRAGAGGVGGGPGVGIGTNAGHERDRGEFKPGEMVKIRTREEIQKTLDANGCCEGLGFMQPMLGYCGRRARVLKKVRTIFDERKWRMVKIRNVYLLEGIVCEGREVFDGEGCDRSCYFFWKDRWLRNVGSDNTL